MFKRSFILLLLIFIYSTVLSSPLSNTLNIDFENAKLEDVIRAISEQSGLNIVLGKNAGMDANKSYNEPLYVNINLDNVTPEQALWTICNSLDLRLYKYDNIYFIENPSLSQQVPAHLKARTVTIDIGDLDADILNNILNNMISTSGKFTIYDATRTVVIKDYPENIEQITEIIDYLKYNQYKAEINKNKKMFDRLTKIKVKDNCIYYDVTGSDTLSLGQFCDFISDKINKPIIVAPSERSFEINFPLKDLEPCDALKEVVKTLKTSMLESEDKISVGINFLVTEVIRLEHISLSKSPVQQVTPVGSSISREIEPQQSYIVPILSQLLTNITPSGITSSLSVDIKTNSVIVTSTFYVIEQFKKDIISKIDTTKKQILIEAYFLKVNTNAFKNMGIDWTVADNRGRNPLYTGTIDLDLNLSSTDITINSKFKNFTITNLIEFLVSQGTAKILSKPRVLVLDNEMAVMSVVTNAWYISAQTTQLDNQGNVITTRTVSEIPNIGIVLKVTPRIKENEIINLEIYPSVRSFHGNQTIDAIDYPLISSENASTILDVMNNKTIAIGGLLREEIEEEEAKTPLLGDIPIIGNLFKRKRQEKLNQELIIFVTPHIVGKGVEEEEIINPDLSSIKKEIPKYSKPVLKIP
ncbi:MAG: hypothetical protein AB1765_05080 [Candidatus Hydrogenedentota bacterium]